MQMYVIMLIGLGVCGALMLLLLMTREILRSRRTLPEYRTHVLDPVIRELLNPPRPWVKASCGIGFDLFVRGSTRIQVRFLDGRPPILRVLNNGKILFDSMGQLLEPQACIVLALAREKILLIPG